MPLVTIQGTDTITSSRATINSNFSYLESIISASGLTVGTSAITSGSSGRVLFESSSNKLSESSDFTFDSSTRLLSVDATGTTTSIHTGPTAGTTNLDVAGCGVEFVGSNNTSGGMNIIFANKSNGASAFTSLFIQNDLADASGTHYGNIGMNSSTYNDNTFGTLINVPNQLGITNTDGPITVGAFKNTAVINFAVGGAATTNEIGRFTTTTFRVGFPGTLTGNISFAGGTSGTAILTTSAVAGTPTITLPTTTGTLATLANSEAFTNKTYNGLTLTSTTGTFTLTNGKTFAVTNGLTLSGTDSTVMTFPSTSATIARTDAANTFTGVQTMTSPSITTSLVTGSTTFALLNTTATTINAFGAATTLNIGASATTVLNFGGSTSAAEFRFLEPSGSGTNYTAFKAQAQSANITYTLPATVASAGQVLTDAAGNGTLSWGNAGSGDMVLASAQTNTGAKTFNSNTFWDKGNIVFNVKAYGAVGNDSTDDTASIQAAVDAAGAVGGVVWFPAGTYKITTTAILLYNGSTPYSGITLAGAGAGKAIIKQYTTGIDVIKGLNNTSGGVQLLNATIRDLKLDFGGTSTNSGNGIYLKQNAADGPAFQQICIENVSISNMNATGKYGFNAESLIVSSLKNVMCVDCKNGFYLNGGAFGGYDSINTSVNFINCYANGTGTAIGYNVLKSQYITFTACAADGNTSTAYLVDTSNGVSFVGCGTEWATGASATAYKFTGSVQCTINGGYVYQGAGTTTNAVWATGTSTGIVVTALNYYQDGGTLTNGVLVDAGSEVIDIKSKWGPGAGTVTNTTNINATGIYKTPGTPRRTTETSSATPTINVGKTDVHTITALTTAITSMTTNLTGTAEDGQKLIIAITGTASRAITWGASFEASGGVALPTTTSGTARLDVGFIWNAATSKWRCLASA